MAANAVSRPTQFRLTAQEIAGVDLKEWFRKTISSTEELDYPRPSTGLAFVLAPRLPRMPIRKSPRPVEARDSRRLVGFSEGAFEKAVFILGRLRSDSAFS